MYAPPGAAAPDVGDLEVVSDGDRLHLFHLTLPNHDVIQHAVSDDGLTWRPLPPALRTGEPGDADDDQVWTMSVVRDPARDRWVMLYTALSSADGGTVQRIGMATSRDLVRWQKSPANPVAAPDPRWYEADPAGWGSVSFRDPKTLRVGDRWHATFDAREAGGPFLRRGCVGLLVSDDLETWRVEPPLFAPRRFWDLEVPQAFRLADDPADPGSDTGPWALTASVIEDRTQRYWLADRFRGPWRTPPDGGILAPRGHYAGRVTRWRGDLLLWCWHQPRLQDGWLSTPESVDWRPPRNPFGKHVAAPLALRPRPDGTLACHSFAGWDAYAGGAPAPLPAPARTLFHDRPAAGPWHLAAPDGTDLLAGDASFGDVLAEGTLHLAAPVGGLGFRLDADGGGYFVEIRSRERQALLLKWLPSPPPWLGGTVTRLRELQRGPLPPGWAEGDSLPFRLVVNGPSIEVSLAGEVVLADASGERAEGRLGIWADSGTVRAEGFRAAPMRRVGA